MSADDDEGSYAAKNWPEDDEGPQLSDVPGAIKYACLWPIRLYGNFPDWLRWICGAVLFFSSIYFADPITSATNTAITWVSGTVGSVNIGELGVSNTQTFGFVLGIMTGLQYRNYVRIMEVADKVDDMHSFSVATDGGRDVLDEGEEDDQDGRRSPSDDGTMPNHVKRAISERQEESVVVTEGQKDDSPSTGGGALGGAIAGGAIGATFGPSGLLGGIIAGAIFGDNLERMADKKEADA